MVTRNMAPHVMLRLGGNFFDSDQTWSCGLRFRSATGGDPGGIADIQTRLEAWRDGIKALNGGAVVGPLLQQYMSVATRLTSVRCSAIGTDGKESAVAVLEKDYIAMGGSAVACPSQVALAITLDTGLPGAANRGRIYWPALGASLGPQARIGSVDTMHISSEVAGWIVELENAGATAITPGLTLSVLSTTKGTAKPVQQVRVGDRLDIQRRRADKEKEGYTVAVVSR